MKKILSIIIFILLATPTWGFAATYYALATANIDATDEWCSNTDATCTAGTKYTFGTGGFPAEGSTLDAVSFVVTINTDPGPNGKVLLTNTGGGNFAYGTASNLTLTVDVTAGTADCLKVSGSTGGGTIGISGSHFTGSTGTSGADAIADSHTVVTVNYVGKSTGIQGNGIYFLGATGAVILTGDCQGGDSYLVSGCRAADAGTFKVIGNLLTGKYGSAMIGRCLWEPGPTNYILFPADTTYDPDNAIDAHAVVAGPVADGNSWTNSNTLTTEAEIKTGKYVGTALGTMSAGGGGGAWGF